MVTAGVVTAGIALLVLACLAAGWQAGKRDVAALLRGEREDGR